MSPLAIVTGASSGIGEALSVRLKNAGYDLLLVARREPLLADLQKRLGSGADVFVLDLAKPDAAERLFARAPDAKVVVNNAGFGKVGDALSFEPAVYEQMIALNVATLTQITLRYARQMAAKGGGTILNVGSTSGFQPIPFQAVYAATKAYVMSLTESLSFELRDKNVRVLGLYPGPTRTEFGEVAGSLDHQRRHARFFMEADEVAELAMRQIRDGTERVVAGGLNNVAATLSQVGPRSVVRRISAALFKPQ